MLPSPSTVAGIICLFSPDLLSTDIFRVEVAARITVTESRWSSKMRGGAHLQQRLNDLVLYCVPAG